MARYLFVCGATLCLSVLFAACFASSPAIYAERKAFAKTIPPRGVADFTSTVLALANALESPTTNGHLTIQVTSLLTSEVAAELLSGTGDAFANALNALTAPTTSSSSSKKRQEVPVDTRAPHDQLNSLHQPPFPTCTGSSTPFDVYIQPAVAATIIMPADGVCGSTGDWNREAALHIATTILQVTYLTVDALCEASKADGVGTLPGIPCIPVSGLICIGKPIAGILLAASLSINSQCNLNDEAVLDSYTEATFLNVADIHDAVKCLKVAAPRKYHGCNGADDNCDLQIDECAEDTFAPNLHLDVAGYNAFPYFNSWTAASSAVSSVVWAVDDCKLPVTVGAPTYVGSCDNVVATVTASDQCSNSDSISVGIAVDTQAPAITCNVTKAWLEHVRMPLLVDVGFEYWAADNCVTPTVTITVLSDEPPVGTFFPDAYVLREYDGSFAGVQVRNAALNVYGRVFLITATATDLAGNTASCTSTVHLPAVAPNPNPNFSSEQFFSVL